MSVVANARAHVLASHVVAGALSNHTGFRSELEKPKPGTVAMVGAPLCEGQTMTGVKQAPDAIRNGGLSKVLSSLGWGFKDLGDSTALAAPAEALKKSDAPLGSNYYKPEEVLNSKVVGAGVGNVYKMCKDAAVDGNFVLTVGGDHSVGSGTIMGLLASRPELAVVWVDAHGDCNTPATSPSANYHGMPLAHCLGWFGKRVDGFEWCDDHVEKMGPLLEERVAIIALRDVDEEERKMLLKSKVHIYSMTDIDRHGIGAIMEMALDRIDPKGRRPLHLSFDIDSCCPSYASGTGTKARGGLSYREAHYICERLAETTRLGSMDMVEINPEIDSHKEEDMHGDDPNITGTETVRLGIELVASALGKRTL